MWQNTGLQRLNISYSRHIDVPIIAGIKGFEAEAVPKVVIVANSVNLVVVHVQPLQ